MLSECKSRAHKSLHGLDVEDENTCLHCREREILIQYHRSTQGTGTKSSRPTHSLRVGGGWWCTEGGFKEETNGG